MQRCRAQNGQDHRESNKKKNGPEKKGNRKHTKNRYKAKRTYCICTYTVLIRHPKKRGNATLPGPKRRGAAGGNTLGQKLQITPAARPPARPLAQTNETKRFPGWGCMRFYNDCTPPPTSDSTLIWAYCSYSHSFWCQTWHVDHRLRSAGRMRARPLNSLLCRGGCADAPVGRPAGPSRTGGCALDRTCLCLRSPENAWTSLSLSPRMFTWSPRVKDKVQNDSPYCSADVLFAFTDRQVKNHLMSRCSELSHW